MPHYKRILFPTGAWRLVLTVLILGFLLAGLGCRAKTPSGPDTGATRQVVDEGGRSLTVPAKIDRVVSLAPNLTEVVFAVGAGDKLVGVTSYCDYPEAARKITKVGDTIQPNIEAIVALHPQIVLVSTSSQLESFVQKMREQNIAVYVTDPHDLEGIFRTIANVGDLLGVKENAARELEKLRARTSVVEGKVKTQPPVSVFFQLSREPLYTIGKDAYVTDLIRRAGGESVTRDVPGAFPTYSAEAALAARPEAIVMTSGDSMGGKINSRVVESLQRSPAVMNGRVYEINGDLLSRPGPRVVDGVEQMAKALHPDLF
jgi:iron complex transport system substrate-binding protein